jgi:hypothetical protein
MGYAMKHTKIIVLIAITSIYSSEIMFSRPGGSSQRSSGSSRSSSRPSNIGSGTKQIGGAGGMQKTNLQDNTGKKGALAVSSQNNQQGISGDHAAAGGAALAARRNNLVPATTESTSDDSSSDQTVPATLENPVVQDAGPAEPVIADQNNDEIPDSPAAITPEPSLKTMVSTVVPHQTPSAAQQVAKESHAVTTSTEQSSEDILKKLKTLEIIETKTDTMLQNSSVDLLFNNFVHLKEFITKNFEKEKMLNLCKELINQIYPAEKEVIKITQEPIQAPEELTPATTAIQAPESTAKDPAQAPTEQSESAEESDDSQDETEEKSSENNSEEPAA